MIYEEYVDTPAGTKKKAKKQRAPVEYPDSLHSKQLARVIDLVSEGEIVGLVDQTNPAKSIYLDDVVVMNSDGTTNYTGITIEERVGTQVQEYIPGFSEVEGEQGVGIQIKKLSPKVITITDSRVTAVRVTIGIPTMVYQNPSNGDTSGTTVELSMEIRTGADTNPYVPIENGTTSFNLTANGVAGLTSTTNTPIVSSASINIRWDGINNGSWGISQECTYSVEYREIGATPWTVFTTGSFSGYATSAYISNGDYAPEEVLTIPSATKTLNIPIFTTLVGYEFRVVKSSGLGALTMPSGNANMATGTITITGKTTSKYQRSYRIPLTGGVGPWSIRVNRNTADSTTSALTNDTWFDSYTEIIENKLRYPNSAMIAMTLDAEQFDDIPKRGYDIKGMLVKVPTNYFPEKVVVSSHLEKYTRNVLTGADEGTLQVWDGNFYIAWTDNPAWCFYDLVTAKRYGVGDYISEALVDRWGLYEIAQYCDELVPSGFGAALEPRFTCNIYLQTREEAYKVINTMASIFRGMAYWATGHLLTVQDSPKAPTAIFNRSNVIDGEFNYQGASARTRHTVALVSWNDPVENYESKVEYIEDEEGITKFGINQTEITAVGCTSRGQANRVGRWLLYTERLESEVVSFKTGLNGLTVYPGAIIRTVDSIRNGGIRNGGRVLSGSTADLILLDGTYDHNPAFTYTASIVLPDGKIESRTVTTPDLNNIINKDRIIPTVSFSSAPQDKAMWILSQSNLATELWRVVSIKEVENTQAEITAVSYKESKYDEVELGLVIEPIPTSSIRILPDAPSQGSITDSIYQTGPSICTKISVAWVAVPSVVRYAIKYKRDNDSWVTLPETRSPSVEILNAVDASTYIVRVTSINGLGRESSQFLSLTHTVVGKLAPPSNVITFTSTVRKNDILLEWGDITDVDRDMFCITDVGTDTNTVPPGAAPAQSYIIGATNYTLPVHTTGTHNYFIRAIDTTGNYSLVFKEVSFTIVKPSTPTVSQAFDGPDVRLSWGDCTTSHTLDYYIIKKGGASFTDPVAILIGNSYATSISVPVTWSTSEKFWVRARDIAGNEGDVGSATVTIVAPVMSGSLTPSTSGSNQVLSWSPATKQSLPIVSYELRQGSTWDSSSILATILPKTSANTYTLPITWTTSTGINLFTAAVDSVGLYSNKLSVARPTITKPSVPANIQLTISSDKRNYTLTWDAPATHTLDIQYYDIRIGTDWINNTRFATSITRSFTFPINWADTRTFQIAAIDVASNEGTPGTSSTINITAPSAIVLTTENVLEDRVQLAWGEPSSILPINYYDIRYDGASWAASTNKVLNQQATSYRVAIDWLGSRTFWVNSVNTNGTSGTSDSVTFNVVIPRAPQINHTINKDSFDLTWSIPTVSLPDVTLPIVEYRIKYGADWATGTTVGTSNTNVYTVKGTWDTDGRTFWIAAVDVNGNEGIPGSRFIDIDVSAAPPNFREQVVDNNVLLYWDQVQGTLPTASYELRKGPTWDHVDTILIGKKSGGFTSVFETIGAVYTYWIAAVDTAGNYGTPKSVSATVTSPPDYILKDDFNSALNGELTNGYVDTTGLIVPVDSAETYTQHFNNIRVSSMTVSASGSGYAVGDTFSLNTGTALVHATGIVTDIAGVDTGPVDSVSLVTMGNYTAAPNNPSATTSSDGGTGLTVTRSTVGAWVGPQNQVDAGFPIYAQPNRSPATYTEIIDYGADVLISASKVTVTQTSTNISGSVDSVCTISVAGAPISGTYTQTAYTITISATGNWTTGDIVLVDFTSGASPDNTYTVVTGTTGSFTITSPNSVSTSGNCTVIGPWTTYTDVWETYAQNFRYVKVSITYTAPTATDLLLVTSLKIRLDLKLKTITHTMSGGDITGVIANVSGNFSRSGTVPKITITGATGTWVAGRDVDLKFSVTAEAPPDGVYEITTGGTNTFVVDYSPLPSSTITGTCTIDEEGTPFYLTVDGTPTGAKVFIDVDAIQVTGAYDSTVLTPMYNFEDTPNPLVCKVLLFNAAGARQPGTASVTVRGF